ncbi:hypothetical protein ACJJTC_016663 [Scirpophaga incertulas]
MSPRVTAVSALSPRRQFRSRGPLAAAAASDCHEICLTPSRDISYVTFLLRELSHTKVVKPKSVEVSVRGRQLADGEILGPLLERQKVEVVCTVLEGKPQPEVVWLFNGKKLDGKS